MDKMKLTFGDLAILLKDMKEVKLIEDGINTVDELICHLEDNGSNEIYVGYEHN